MGANVSLVWVALFIVSFFLLPAFSIYFAVRERALRQERPIAYYFGALLGLIPLVEFITLLILIDYMNP